MLARIGVGVEVSGGEVEQGVLLGEVEVLHGASNSRKQQYTRTDDLGEVRSGSESGARVRSAALVARRA